MRIDKAPQPRSSLRMVARVSVTINDALFAHRFESLCDLPKQCKHSIWIQPPAVREWCGTLSANLRISRPNCSARPKVEGSGTAW